MKCDTCIFSMLAHMCNHVHDYAMRHWWAMYDNNEIYATYTYVFQKIKYDENHNHVV